MKKYFLALGLLMLPQLVLAHGVGEVYALPIPLKYYLSASGIAVAISFFVFAYFLGSTKPEFAPPPSRRFRGLRAIILILRSAIMVWLLLSIATGVFGMQDALKNFAPIYFWVYFLLGMSILSVLVGNIWDLVNPWKLIARSTGAAPGTRRVPRFLGPLLVFLLYWLELASGQSFSPMVLGSLLLVYTVVNLLMYVTFADWFERGEVFSVLFGFIGKLSHWHLRENPSEIVPRPLGSRLSGQIFGWQEILLAGILLAGTSFDSFKETTLWFRLLYNLNLSQLPPVWADTLGLLLSPLPFIGLYLLIIWLMAKLVGQPDWRNLSRQFVISLIPIAFGYTLAHNFSLLIATAPQAARLLSDPFGFGWNIFGMNMDSQTGLILGAKLIWFIEIGFVVLAHIVGTLYAHVLAVNVVVNPKKVLVSQYPALVLMVIFTVSTLWLLSQPLVVSR